MHQQSAIAKQSKAYSDLKVYFRCCRCTVRGGLLPQEEQTSQKLQPSRSILPNLAWLYQQECRYSLHYTVTSSFSCVAENGIQCYSEPTAKLHYIHYNATLTTKGNLTPFRGIEAQLI